MISLEWVLGIFLSVIGVLVGWIFISALRDIKESLSMINQELKSLDSKTDNNERSITVHDYRLQALEHDSFGNKQLADDIINKIKAITPR